jgi:hypothetical protein
VGILKKTLSFAAAIVVGSAVSYAAYIAYQTVKYNSCANDRVHFYEAMLQTIQTQKKGCETLEGSVRYECLQDLKTRIEKALEDSKTYFIKRDCPNE